MPRKANSKGTQRKLATPTSGIVATARGSSAVVQQLLTRTPRAFRPDVQTFPNVSRLMMRYGWQGNLSTAAGAATTQAFRLTSLYDPDFTGTGAQPKYFDTLCGATGGSAPYTFFRVRKTHYRVGFFNNTSTSSGVSYGYSQVYLTNPVSTTASLNTYFEEPNLTVCMLSTNGNDNTIQWIEGSVDHAKFLGVKDIDDDEDLVGSYSSNPPTNDFLVVGVRAMDDTTVTGIRATVQLVYEVELFSLNNASASSPAPPLTTVTPEPSVSPGCACAHCTARPMHVSQRPSGLPPLK